MLPRLVYVSSNSDIDEPMQWNLIERTVNYSTAGSTVQCSVEIDHFSGYSFTGEYAFVSKTSGKKLTADSFTAFVYVTRDEDDAREIEVCIVHNAGIEVRNHTDNQGLTRRVWALCHERDKHIHGLSPSSALYHVTFCA